MSLHSPIGRAGASADSGELARETAEQERQDRERSAAWASAITQVLVEARPKLTLPSAPEPDATPATPAPRSGGDLSATPGGAEAGTTPAAGEAQPDGPPLPQRVVAELSDNRLGRMELSVARGANGLHIVINVADAHVKALIEAEQALLVKSLQGCGLRVDSVQIADRLEPGIALAPEQAARERALARSRGNLNLRSANARWRGYGAPLEEDPEDDPERVDFTA